MLGKGFDRLPGGGECEKAAAWDSRASSSLAHDPAGQAQLSPLALGGLGPDVLPS